MKVLELMHVLEEAYDRFGDIDINVRFEDEYHLIGIGKPIGTSIESEEVIIIAEQINNDVA